MPWKIVNSKTKLGKFILPNHVYTVGRIEGDIIANDKSVSRIHANITYDVEKQVLCIEDLSKFGTFINSVPLKNKKGFTSDGDIVTFGAQPGVDFQLVLIQFNLIMSTLNQSDKMKLKDYTKLVGGGLLNDWNKSVGYLVMTELKVTYKVICALINQVPIVTSSFIKEMCDYFLGTRADEPEPNNFLPPTTDVNIVDKNISFKVKKNRATLFAGKIFYFMTASKLSHLQLAVSSAGGEMVLLTDGNFDYEATLGLLSSENSLVMYESVESKLVNQIYTILKRLRKRPVIDSEIGFAVLHITLDEYCNPYRRCSEKIYSETHLTQFLSVNPFHMDGIESENSPKEEVYQKNDLKRSYREKESSETGSENISKKRKVSSPTYKKQMPEKVIDQLQLVEDVDENKSSKNKITGKVGGKVTTMASPKKRNYLQNLLKENNNFFGTITANDDVVEVPELNEGQIDGDFDEFDQVEIPMFGSEAPLNNTARSLFNEASTSANKKLLCFDGKQREGFKDGDFESPGKEDESPGSMMCEESTSRNEEIKAFKTNEFKSHTIKLLPSSTVNSKPVQSCTDEKPIVSMKSDCKLSIFENLVVENMAHASCTNVNFKTFKRVSPVYINCNPIAMEVFNRKNYQ